MEGGAVAEPYWHYYSFTFQDSPSVGSLRTASVYIGYRERGLITKARIEDAKKTAGVSDGAALLSVCYLGRMTNAEFAGEGSDG